MTRGLIKDRVKKLAEDIDSHFGNDALTCLVVLRGAFRFAKDLIKEMEDVHTGQLRQLDVEFIRARSYQANQRKELKLEGIDGLNLAGKKVLVIEDLVDSGNTLSNLVRQLRELEPADLRVVALTYKRNPENTFICLLYTSDAADE